MAGPDREPRPAQRPPSARVFFALWPDPPVRAALYRHGQALHREVGGKLTRADSVHLTLLFLGNVPEASVPALLGAAEGVRFAPFAMRIDTAKCWRHNDIAWVGPSAVPPPLADLVA